MDLADARALLSIIKAEESRRWETAPDGEFGFDHDLWLLNDAPFIGEFCLIFLVALRHHVERQVIHFAALDAGEGQAISREDYNAHVKSLRTGKNNIGWNWEEVKKRLKLEECARYPTYKALQLLANAYKHELGMTPDPKLIKHLGLDPTLNYADLPASGEVEKGLASIVGLPEGARYTDIAERIVDHVDEFLNDIEARNTISPFKREFVDFTKLAH